MVTNFTVKILTVGQLEIGQAGYLLNYPYIIVILLCATLPSNFNLQYSSYKHVHVFKSRVENSVDPDQLASEKPADLALHCSQNKLYPSLG